MKSDIILNGRQKNAILYDGDHPLRKHMCTRYLREICGRKDLITDRDISNLDAIPYDHIIRSLIIRELSHGFKTCHNMSTLLRRYDITQRKLNWMLFKK